MISGPTFQTVAGLLLGILISGLAINGLPLAGQPLGAQLGTAIPFVLTWCLAGMAGTHLAYALEPRFKPLRFALTMVAVTVALAVAATGVLALLADLGLGGPILAVIDRLDLLLQTLWAYLLFGGSALWGFIAARRQERLQVQQTQAEVAARESEAELHVGAARALRGQVQSERLTALIETLKARYAASLDRGDRLLERLTEFLRTAMPSVRTGASTLGRELDTLNAFGRMLAEVGAGQSWTVRRSMSAQDFAFPPLLLLPTAEALASSGDGSLDVMLASTPEGTAVSFTSRGGNLAEELETRLRTGLDSAFGERAAITLRGPYLEIRIAKAAA